MKPSANEHERLPMWFRPPYPIAEILWDDASALDPGWLSHEESVKHEHVNALVRSIGFIIQDNEDSVIYCSDVDKAGETNGRSRIPKAMVKSIRYLTKPRKPKLVPPE